MQTGFAEYRNTFTATDRGKMGSWTQQGFVRKLVFIALLRGFIRHTVSCPRAPAMFLVWASSRTLLSLARFDRGWVALEFVLTLSTSPSHTEQYISVSVLTVVSRKALMKTSRLKTAGIMKAGKSSWFPGNWRGKVDHYATLSATMTSRQRKQKAKGINITPHLHRLLLFLWHTTATYQLTDQP